LFSISESITVPVAKYPTVVSLVLFRVPDCVTVPLICCYSDRTLVYAVMGKKWAYPGGALSLGSQAPCFLPN
jgi:hypothetical protein